MSTRRAGFTTRASCLLAAGLTAVLCGLLLGEIDLVRAGVLAAAVPCVAALVVQRSRVQVANRRSIEPAQAAAGEAVTVHLVITNRSVLRTGTLMLEDQLPDRLTGHARFVLDPLGGREARTVSYRMPGLARGRYRVGPLRIRLCDPFRMIDLTRSFTATSEFVVAPVVDALPAVDPPRSDDVGESVGSHSVGTHGADDQSTREYRTGDDLRKIHWRSSARTGVLMVRQEERPWRGQSTVVLDLRAAAHERAPGDVPLDAGTDPRLNSSLEWAVSAAASIGCHLLRRGRELSVLADDSSERRRFGDSGGLITHLAAVHEVGRRDLSPMVGSLRTATRDSTVIAILGRLDSATLRTLADSHPRGRSTPAAALLLDVATWRDPDAEPSAEVDAAAAVLRNAGWRVATVRCGMPIAYAWQLLLAGAATPDRAAALR
jgi:Uncharacterized conserved protein (some members contain a von Willebrand factor type A (vWA) domain)